MSLKTGTLASVNWASSGGLWVPCAGQTSPWQTHLGSEEYPPDARDWEARTICIAVIAFIHCARRNAPPSPPPPSRVRVIFHLCSDPLMFAPAAQTASRREPACPPFPAAAASPPRWTAA